MSPKDSKIKLISIISRQIGDLDTPVSAYLKLRQPHSFLLESVEGGERIARYSYIGLDPFFIFISDGTRSILKEKNKEILLQGHPLEALEKTIQRFEVEDHPFSIQGKRLPKEALPPFCGGAVGFFSWETIGLIEKINFKKKSTTDVPLMQFMFPRTLVIFDHVKRELIVMTLTEPGTEDEAHKRLEKVSKALQKPIKNSPLDMTQSNPVLKNVSFSLEKKEFIAGVKKAKQHIFEGDVFQLVYSQKFTIKSKRDPFDIYRRLRIINPSPYMFYVDFEDYQLVGASPEILVRLQNKKALLRPIAGTRPRIPGQEEVLASALLEDPKEIAEHMMLVDLGRNDLGRVCQYGSVKTEKMMSVETYSHVLHMVSDVTGELRPGKTAFDLFRATFPAGTLSGAPKIRAVQIIEELEPDMRGIYGGALGYIDFRGNMDLCIIIRTALCKGQTKTIQAGAGLVADSVPETEYEESINKATAMLKACQ